MMKKIFLKNFETYKKFYKIFVDKLLHFSIKMENLGNNVDLTQCRCMGTFKGKHYIMSDCRNSILFIHRITLLLLVEKGILNK